MSIYEKKLKIKVDKIVSEIEEIEKNLRCCGNCLNFKGGNCELGYLDKYVSGMSFKVCDEWSADRLTYLERKI